MPTNEKRPDMDVWLERETEPKQNDLENASEHFDESDPFSVNTLESVYATESSFGVDVNKRGIAGPSGHFQMKKETAQRYKLTVTPENDERHDLGKSSVATANHLKDQYRHFSKETNLGSGLKTTVVADHTERKKFAIAAVNAGEGRISKAQRLAEEDGKNPTIWDEVKDYLVEAGATPTQAEETQAYVEKVLKHEEEFKQRSKANKKRKDEQPKEIENPTGKGHWITKDDRRIFIEE